MKVSMPSEVEEIVNSSEFASVNRPKSTAVNIPAVSNEKAQVSPTSNAEPDPEPEFTPIVPEFSFIEPLGPTDEVVKTALPIAPENVAMLPAVWFSKVPPLVNGVPKEPTAIIKFASA